jgi:hypothetical protein
LRSAIVTFALRIGLVGAIACAATAAALAAESQADYRPYAAGPYAEGKYVAFVPWEALKPFLTAAGARIFGGVRPEGDDDGTQ